VTSPERLSAELSAIAGRNMRVLRERAGLKQAGLGKLLGKGASGICRMEKGERRIACAELALLADIFGVAPAGLTGECQNCQGSPPPGFACLACGAEDSGPRPAAPPCPETVPRYLTVTEVMKVLRTSRKTVLELVRKGELENVVRVGSKTLRIPASDVEAFLRSHSALGASQISPDHSPGGARPMICHGTSSAHRKAGAPVLSIARLPLRNSTGFRNLSNQWSGHDQGTNRSGRQAPPLPE
jgi:excisionase family DNA binding protein